MCLVALLFLNVAAAEEGDTVIVPPSVGESHAPLDTEELPPPPPESVDASAELFGSSNVETIAPETPASAAPETPASAAPETPASAAPETPASAAPETPATAIPETPVSVAPPEPTLTPTPSPLPVELVITVGDGREDVEPGKEDEYDFSGIVSSIRTVVVRLAKSMKKPFQFNTVKSVDVRFETVDGGASRMMAAKEIETLINLSTTGRPSVSTLEFSGAQTLKLVGDDKKFQVNGLKFHGLVKLDKKSFTGVDISGVDVVYSTAAQAILFASQTTETDQNITIEQDLDSVKIGTGIEFETGDGKDAIDADNLGKVSSLTWSIKSQVKVGFDAGQEPAAVDIVFDAVGAGAGIALTDTTFPANAKIGLRVNAENSATLSAPAGDDLPVVFSGTGLVNLIAPVSSVSFLHDMSFGSTLNIGVPTVIKNLIFRALSFAATATFRVVTDPNLDGSHGRLLEDSYVDVSVGSVTVEDSSVLSLSTLNVTSTGYFGFGSHTYLDGYLAVDGDSNLTIEYKLGSAFSEATVFAPLIKGTPKAFVAHQVEKVGDDKEDIILLCGKFESDQCSDWKDIVTDDGDNYHVKCSKTKDIDVYKDAPDDYQCLKLGKGGLSGGAIAGIVIACVVVVAIIIIVAVVVSKKKKHADHSSSSSSKVSSNVAI